MNANRYRYIPVLLLCGLLARAENLVSNGSFENGISGWQFSGGLSIIGPPAFQPLGVDGTHSVCIGGADLPNSWIEQTISVETNIEYRLSLDEAAGGDNHAGRTGIIRVDVHGGPEPILSQMDARRGLSTREYAGPTTCETPETHRSGRQPPPLRP
jgi:hypothetical protein